MSIELKIKFNNMNELSSFINDNPSVQTSKLASVDVPPVIKEATVSSEPTLTKAQKAAKTKAKNKALKEAAEKEAAALTQAQVAPMTTAASVMAAPVAAPVEAVATIDRDAYANHARALVGRLQALGIADADIPVKLQELYTNAGIEYKIVSELADADMVTIVSAFDYMVSNLETSAKAGVTQTFV